MTSDIDEAVLEIVVVLAGEPGLDKHEVFKALGRASGSFGTVKEVNHALYAHRTLFCIGGGAGERPLWFLTDAALVLAPHSAGRTGGGDPAPAPPGTGPRRILKPISLYPWQERALAQWRDNDCRGVVEAVTGAGKTRLALQAVLEVLAAGGKAAVIVPTVELVRQWHRELQRHVVAALDGPVAVLTLGDGMQGSLADADLLVATASSAARWPLHGGDEVTHLLVADECHHYGAEVWSRALEEEFDQRLGLTATYERSDNGIDDWLDPYFGGACYTLGYREALDDDVIAPFRIAFVGVKWANLQEASKYEEADLRARTYRRRLIEDWELPAEPFGVFMVGVERLRASGVAEGSRLAGFYLSAFAKRRTVMAESSAKISMLQAVGASVDAADRTIVFSQTVAAANAAVAALRELGHRGESIESLMTSEERRETFDDFERGDLNVIAAPKLLDEGVDVPAADLAFVLATSRSKRQLIQRMGRVIRKKADGRPARVVVLYQAGTAEDPDGGAHEDFIGSVVEVAQAVEAFPPGSDPADIVVFLRPDAAVTRRRLPTLPAVIEQSALDGPHWLLSDKVLGWPVRGKSPWRFQSGAHELTVKIIYMREILHVPIFRAKPSGDGLVRLEPVVPQSDAIAKAAQGAMLGVMKAVVRFPPGREQVKTFWLACLLGQQTALRLIGELIDREQAEFLRNKDQP